RALVETVARRRRLDPDRRDAGRRGRLLRLPDAHRVERARLDLPVVRPQCRPDSRAAGHGGLWVLAAAGRPGGDV
ncbi:MAG: hypothetical protein AVDCRST_MAG33-2754, partial [uncultured Thermomicrobiales bacterium]